MFKLSPEADGGGYIALENKFIVEYLPYADGDYVKVYLYALSLAERRSDDDTQELLARRLGLDSATVDAAIEYWEAQGLMARLGGDIALVPPRAARAKIKKYDVDKYAEFNRQAQLYIAARQISPNEYNEYYALMEKFELEWQAMTLIVKYCVNLKGENVSCPYILAVARNLAADGYRTYDSVENRLEEYGVYYNDLCEVTSVLGGKRPDHEAIKLYKKWTREYKYDKALILSVAKTIKRGGIASLDYKLTSYRELGLATYAHIEKYELERKELYALAKSTCKALGVYYENVDPVIVNYVRPWLDMGLENGAILAAAEYCMKSGLKTLDDLDTVVRDFFAAGLTTEEKVRNRVDRDSKYDADITELMKYFEMIGAVKNTFRAYYLNWRDKLDMPKDVIQKAAERARGKANPFAYTNSILSAWDAAGAKTVEAASALSAAEKEAAAAKSGDNTNAVAERYTAEELDAMFTDLSEE